MKLILKSNLIIAFVLLVVASSCQKDGLGLDGEKDYIIFGSSYGFCEGECATSYLLKHDGLYKSTSYLRTGRLNTFSEKLNAEKFNQVRGFEQKIPAEFLDEKKPETTFGCPDCTDQGRVVFGLRKEGQIRLLKNYKF